MVRAQLNVTFIESVQLMYIRRGRSWKVIISALPWKCWKLWTGVWFFKSKKWVSRPGSLLSLEAKAPWTSWVFNFGGFTDSLHPHKQETRSLGAIQATSFFPWWLLLFFQDFFRQRKICKKSWNWQKSWEITGLFGPLLYYLPLSKLGWHNHPLSYPPPTPM